MRLLPIALIAAGLLLVGNGISSTKPATVASAPRVTAEMELDQTLELYFFACEMVKAKFPEKADEHCPVSPIALFTKLARQRHGEYSPGSRIVWLNDNFTTQPQISTYGEGVSVHEMVHYILWDYDLLQTEKEYCREENLAWESHDRWVESRGRPEDMNPKWWVWYDECDNATDDARSIVTKIIGFLQTD